MEDALETTDEGRLCIGFDGNSNNQVVCDENVKYIASMDIALESKPRLMTGDSGQFTDFSDLIIKEAQSISIINLSDIIMTLPYPLTWSISDLYLDDSTTPIDCYLMEDDHVIKIPSECINFNLE